MTLNAVMKIKGGKYWFCMAQNMGLVKKLPRNFISSKTLILIVCDKKSLSVTTIMQSQLMLNFFF